MLRPAIRPLALLACLLLAAATAFPAIGVCHTPRDTPEWFSAITVTAFGWLGAMFGQFGWFANIPFVLNAAALLRGRRASVAAAGVEAVLVGWATLPIPLPPNEAWTDPVCAHGPGFWLWAGANALMIATALLAARGARGSGPTAV